MRSTGNRAVARAAGIACLAGLTALLVGCGGLPTHAIPAPTATTSAPAPSAATPGTATATTRTRPAGPVTKLLVFVEENHSLAQMKAGMPYAFGLAERFGHATTFVAIAHPSLPNYIAIAGGKTYAIDNDRDPSENAVDGPSVFGRAIAGGKTAAVYADGMPGTCAPRPGGIDYAVKHNPWPYFTAERALCQQYDVGLDRLDAAITAGTLPNAGMVIPNLEHDAHDGSLRTADAWFKGWMTRIFNGPDWKSGQLAVVLTADEDDRSAGNVVLTVVIHPSQHGTVVRSPLTHYSLTRLYAEVTGTGALFNARAAPSLAKAFGLPLP